MSTQFCVGPAHEPDRIRLGPAAASGAEGVLYRGYVDLPDGPVPLAVKMLHPGHLGRLEEWTARWRDQVRLLRQVEVPGLVAVRGGFVGPLPHAPGQADESTATLYLVMEWVDGVSLDQWARSLVDPAPEQLLLALVPVAAALDLLHSGAATGGQPVVHRDVKPANVLVRPEGDTVLVDLGSVRGLAGGHGRASLVGTAGYIAPEVLADGRYGPAADRYSLGAVAYFLLTGEEPMARPEPGELRRRLVDAPLVHGRADLADHIATMLDPDPDLRPECLANWVAQLRRSSLVGLSGELPIPQRAPARNPSAPRTVAPNPATRTRRRRAAGVVAAVAAIALAIAAFAAAPDRDDPNPVAASGMAVHQLAPATITASGVADPATNACGQQVSYQAENAFDGDPSTAWRPPEFQAVGHTLLVNLRPRSR
jgi:serine/threonine protein kinase